MHPPQSTAALLCILGLGAVHTKTLRCDIACYASISNARRAFQRRPQCLHLGVLQLTHKPGKINVAHEYHCMQSSGTIGIKQCMMFAAPQSLSCGPAGDQGVKMVNMVHETPGIAIPVVLSRLKQKDSEWRKVKQDMSPLWQKVCRPTGHASTETR